MRDYSKITPEGTKDILFDECKAQRYIERKLSKSFALRGFNEILTPGIEYYDVFQIPNVSIPQDQMYKLTDNNGRLIVFRPDSTLPIARMASARLQNAKKPIRLFYNQCTYRNSPDHLGRRNEIPQMGIEILGADGLKADAEAIMLAIDSMSAFAPGFRLEIGNAIFFNSLIEKLDITGEKKEAIRSTIETKNYAALDILLDGMKSSSVVDSIRQLPRLFGGEEILIEAERFAADEDSAAMLEHMKQLYALLSKTEVKDRIIIDLGLVQRNDYYTGIIFSAYSESHGDAILTGGRYNALLEKFGDKMPAVGFSIDTNALTEIMLKNGAENEVYIDKSIVYAEPGGELKVQEVANSIINENRYCEISLFDSYRETEDYAVKNGFSKLLIVNESGTEIKDLGDVK